MFPCIYLHVFLHFPISQLVDFVSNIARCLKNVRHKQPISHFYYNMVWLIQSNRKMNTLRNLKEDHDTIIPHFLSFQKVKQIPHIALYLYAMLSIEIQTGPQVKILKTIALLLNLLDTYSKNVILNNYFQYLIVYHCYPRRK